MYLIFSFVPSSACSQSAQAFHPCPKLHFASNFDSLPIFYDDSGINEPNNLIASRAAFVALFMATVATSTPRGI